MDSAFLDHFRGEQIGWAGGRAVWQTLAPLRYRSVLLGTTVIVPVDFVTDLASVPRKPLAYWIAGGRGTRPSVVHDHPYQCGYWLLEDGRRLAVSKSLTDAVFREALLADPISGADGFIAQLMYKAVCIGGQGHWSDQGERAAKLNPQWTAAGWLIDEAP